MGFDYCPDLKGIKTSAVAWATIVVGSITALISKGLRRKFFRNGEVRYGSITALISKGLRHIPHFIYV